MGVTADSHLTAHFKTLAVYLHFPFAISSQIYTIGGLSFPLKMPLLLLAKH